MFLTPQNLQFATEMYTERTDIPLPFRIFYFYQVGISVSFNIAPSFREIHNNFRKVCIAVKISALNYQRGLLCCDFGKRALNI